MNSEANIYELIRQMAHKGLNIADVGKVLSVDADKGVCDVEIDGKANANGALINVSSGVMILPKVGSDVVVLWLNSVMAVVVMVKEVDRIVIRGGDNGGVVNVNELKSWMKNVESDLITLRNLLLTSPVAGNGAALGITFVPKTKSVADSIEDKLITH